MAMQQQKALCLCFKIKMERRNTFNKSERLCSKILIDKLFKGGSKSFSAYPIRAVFQVMERENQTPVSILISVPKRHFKHAVDRNRVKRQLREAYRTHKYIVWDALNCDINAKLHPQHLAIAFLWLSNEQIDSAKVEHKMTTLLHRIAESLTPKEIDKEQEE